MWLFMLCWDLRLRSDRVDSNEITFRVTSAFDCGLGTDRQIDRQIEAHSHRANSRQANRQTTGRKLRADRERERDLSRQLQRMQTCSCLSFGAPCHLQRQRSPCLIFVTAVWYGLGVPSDSVPLGWRTPNGSELAASHWSNRVYRCCRCQAHFFKAFQKQD